MKKQQIIQAWRSEDSFRNLSAEERASLPANPAGLMEVQDEVLNSVTAAGCSSTWGMSYCTPCPPMECAA